MIVYLAGAIDMVDADTSKGWRDATTKVLSRDNVSTYNPVAAFSIDLNDKKAVEMIVKVNEVALLGSDVVLFYINPRQASIGTPIELYMCHQHGIPRVIVWDDAGGKPLPAYLQYYGGDNIVGNMPSALKAIQKLFEHPKYIRPMSATPIG